MTKIRICEECFEDTDLKKEDVEIVTTEECMDNDPQGLV